LSSYAGTTYNTYKEGRFFDFLQKKIQQSCFLGKRFFFFCVASRAGGAGRVVHARGYGSAMHATNMQGSGVLRDSEIAKPKLQLSRRAKRKS